MEYEVLKEGHILLPHYNVVSETGEIVFVTVDLDPAWRRRRRPCGRYMGVVNIPGNLLSEGKFSIHCCILTLTPDTNQVFAPDVVGFQVIDTLDGDSARGDYVGNMKGAVRPLLKWTTKYFGECQGPTAPAMGEGNR
jgi:lipopolysaccharide transport system ATP-binding protein